VSLAGKTMGDDRLARTDHDDVQRQLQNLDPLDPRQVAIWRRMTPGRRLDLAFQAYHLALEVVRTTERRRHPDLSSEELKWRVIRRMHGDLSLGRPRKVRADE
jgi:hypothetical protein